MGCLGLKANLRIEKLHVALNILCGLSFTVQSQRTYEGSGGRSEETAQGQEQDYSKSERGN